VQPMRFAEILAVGSELLTPHRTDTNSLFLTPRLTEAGIDVRGNAIVGDERADIAGWLERALARDDLAVMTGGLGPTDDDVTREAVASWMGLELVEDASVLAGIEARFARRRVRMPAINRRQALVPRGAVVLANPNGTAPGLWIARGEQAVVLLPGPPREMEAIVMADVLPRLRARGGGRQLRRRVIKTTGWPESHVDEIAAPIYRRWPAIQTTILASPGQIELHVSTIGADVADMDRALEDAVQELARALGGIVFSIDGRSLEQVVGDRLVAGGLRIAVAESCTGGMLLGRLTNVAGSSAWVQGGVVAYDNSVKTSLVGVDTSLLAEFGAVSEPVALAMAHGVRRAVPSDIGVGITGIAGPSGGSAEKPVGTVVIAVAGVTDVVRTFAFIGDRAMVRQQSVTAALEMVRRLVG
jgi:nicotinamide-nucleotide amidase